MKKVLLWGLPVLTLVIGFYIGLVYKKPTIEKAGVNLVEENRVQMKKEPPFFSFNPPAGYDTEMSKTGASVWNKSRPRPTGDADALPDLSVEVRESDINSSLFLQMNPQLLRSLKVAGYNGNYYKLYDDFSGDSYLVVIDVDGYWIYIESGDKKLIDEVLSTFSIKITNI